MSSIVLLKIRNQMQKRFCDKLCGMVFVRTFNIINFSKTLK